jgi:hypothetical protein
VAISADNGLEMDSPDSGMRIVPTSQMPKTPTLGISNFTTGKIQYFRRQRFQKENHNAEKATAIHIVSAVHKNNNPISFQLKSDITQAPKTSPMPKIITL